jgi:hypothetical protein
VLELCGRRISGLEFCEEVSAWDFVRPGQHFLHGSPIRLLLDHIISRANILAIRFPES